MTNTHTSCTEAVNLPYKTNGGSWVYAECPLDRCFRDVHIVIQHHFTLVAFDENEAVIGPIYSIDQIFADPQFQARESITSVMDKTLGEVRMQNVVPRLSETPGRIGKLGPHLGEHNHDVYVKELGHSEADLEHWQENGVI
jgi:crotonobetainyl-CoA:carnitine CoA-transferase CaiB-like acyl-CoA transferase